MKLTSPWLWSIRQRIVLRVRSQTTIDLPSPDNAAKVLPSAENAKLVAGIVKPVSLVVAFLVGKSHTWRCLSSVPTANVLPPGPKAMH